MPAGPAPLGFVYFVGVKFAGYTAAAAILRRAYPKVAKSFWSVGATRTAIGIGFGALYGGLWILLGSKAGDLSPYLYFLGLLPIRIGEWMLLMHIYFDRGLFDPQKAFSLSVGGTVWSYILDAIGIAAAFVIPGGFWVC